MPTRREETFRYELVGENTEHRQTLRPGFGIAGHADVERRFGADGCGDVVRDIRAEPVDPAPGQPGRQCRQRVVQHCRQAFPLALGPAQHGIDQGPVALQPERARQRDAAVDRRVVGDIEQQQLGQPGFEQQLNAQGFGRQRPVEQAVGGRLQRAAVAQHRQYQPVGEAPVPFVGEPVQPR